MKQENLNNWISINEFKMLYKLMVARGKINKILELVMLILFGMWLILAIKYSAEGCPLYDIIMNEDDTAIIGIVFSVLFGIYTLYTLYMNLPLITSISSDQTIQYIENTQNAYRRIRNRNNKVGLCHIWRNRLSLLLPMNYSDIRVYSNSLCVVMANGKCALYNMERHEFMTPMIFESVEKDNDGIIIATSNGVVSKYSQYGNRIS